MAQRRVAGIRENLGQRLEWEQLHQVEKVREKEGRIRKEFERRMNPKTKEDFDLLYHALES